ncbi:hypothetical protein EV356DRAFT_3954 [Viridothelium virens]|uniref:Uncharacterized protein n=1 Tax=Viridothelium virens TaxID=1048519 RepID=A0A6A6HPX4_VIRVR|nr:hypothetical protein EV356DRAFT_3954 [Viridothelium virens]
MARTGGMGMFGGSPRGLKFLSWSSALGSGVFCKPPPDNLVGQFQDIMYFLDDTPDGSRENKIPSCKLGGKTQCLLSR